MVSYYVECIDHIYSMCKIIFCINVCISVRPIDFGISYLLKMKSIVTLIGKHTLLIKNICGNYFIKYVYLY